MQIINQIVDRLHVGASNRAVIKYMVSRMEDGYKTYKTMTKKSRHLLVRQALARHAENKRTYQYIVGGVRW